jgi:hypothetical protein
MQALTLSKAVATFRLDEAVQAPEPVRPSSVAEIDMRDVLKDGRRDASIAPRVERRKAPRPHLRLASRRDS